MTDNKEIYNTDDRVLEEVFGNTKINNKFKKITIDNKEDFEYALTHGVIDLPNEREEMLHNVLHYIFKEIVSGKMSEIDGYFSFEIVTNNSQPPVPYGKVKELWNEYADRFNVDTKHN
ncbi:MULTISPECIES: hypothetical protein [Staphylococcus]|uniref:hypothetical protein n=1 Tax=Staphylococcus TaxID=1279 RepID=UPI0011A271E3|nr:MULTISPECIES: hypothetical protein [Staphylococcus]MBF2261875.1 hypothetical protein [Staphylococcus capitis]MBF2282682.1 hypothetical protein [Staphylococcus capitis]